MALGLTDLPNQREYFLRDKAWSRPQGAESTTKFT
jgi:hypothetical protein